MRFLPRTAFPYSFEVVDQDTPNAFALPGGFIYMSRGLLALANSEDELANVMGHEITHSELRHSAERQAMSQWLGLFSLGFAGAGQLAKYGRDQANEADRGGQVLAAASGYDPHGMGNFLKRLDAVERLARGWSRLPGFFDTHPGSTERVALTIGRAPHVPGKPGEPLAKDQAAFYQKLEGLGVGQNPAEGVFQESRFIHIDMDFSLRFPHGWTMVNTSRSVGAFSPKHDARIALQLDSKGTDPEQAARNFLAEREEKLRIEIIRQGVVQLGKVPAYRIEATARTPEGPLRGIVTWLVHDGFIYRVGYVARPQAFNNYKGRSVSVLRSFRRPSAAEKASVKRLQLHVVMARAGESLAALGSRVGNAWGAQTTAVMNGLFISDQLEAGQLIKVAIAHAYVPKLED